MRDCRILRLPAVIGITGLSRSSIYSFIGSGDFPPPVRLSQNCVGWIEDEVARWVVEKIAAHRRDAMERQR